MKKYTKEELYKMDAVDVYKMVLKGEVIKTFPKGFWQQPEAKQNAAKCIRYLIEKILKYNFEEIKEQLSQRLFKDNGLSGMLKYCFNDSPYKAINSVYLGKFKEWEFKMVPNGYWKNKKNGVRATKWLIEEKLNLNEEEIKKELSYKLFKDNGLGGMLKYCFNSSYYNAINETYPNKFKKSDFKGYKE